MNVLIVNNHITHMHTIKKLFAPSDVLTYISYRQIWWYDLENIDVILLTGSNTHTFASKLFAKEIHILQETRKIIIGICLGCELLVPAFGGVVNKNVERVEWNLSIACENDPKLYTVHESHRYSVIALGDELHWLAKSSYGYEIVKHKTKHIFWFQFHPEVMEPSNDWYNLFLRYMKPLFDEINSRPRKHS